MKPVLFSSAYLTQCFPADYAAAHAAFRDASLELLGSGAYREFPFPESGPDRESLVTGVTWQGPVDADKVLVLQSATHGVEGFAGSAIQLDSLHSLTQEVLPSGCAILYVHALNPYGFAWLRRVNELGVDLNRNFIDFDAPLPRNEDYQLLAGSLVPDSLQDWPQATRAIDRFRDQYGQRVLELAVTSGQYQYSEGLFYGGTSPSRSRLHLEEIITDYELEQRRLVAVIDIHTGLGPFGYGEVICDHPPGTLGVQWAKEWYGDCVTEPAMGSSTSVPKTGLIDYLWHRRLEDRVCFVTLEFGTYSVDRMFDALRRDHYMHRHVLEWSSAEMQKVKQAMRGFFYPATADWQEMVLMRGRQCVGQALQGLCHE